MSVRSLTSLSGQLGDALLASVELIEGCIDHDRAGRDWDGHTPTLERTLATEFTTVPFRSYQNTGRETIPESMS
jgi:hypothetical protein